MTQPNPSPVTLGENKDLAPPGSAQPSGDRTSLNPAAWRVRDFADGWILCHSLKQAQREATAGNLIQPLYVPAAASASSGAWVMVNRVHLEELAAEEFHGPLGISIYAAAANELPRRIKLATAMLAAAPLFVPTGMEEWRPIESAPSDVPILIWSPYGVGVACAHWAAEFTHWMPLPAPPSSPDETAGKSLGTDQNLPPETPDPRSGEG